jgi:hypothetical protein
VGGPSRLRFVETGGKTREADCLHVKAEGGRGGKGDRMPCRRECAGQRDQRMEVTGSGECGEQDAHGRSFLERYRGAAQRTPSAHADLTLRESADRRRVRWRRQAMNGSDDEATEH